MAISYTQFSPLKSSDIIDYKNVDLLRRFITVQGKVWNFSKLLESFNPIF